LFVDDEGNIRTYKFKDFTLDNILCGRILLTLYKVTGKQKYYKAASTLRDQLRQHPAQTKEVFGIRKFIQIKCGLTDFIWQNLFTRSGPPPFMKIQILMISRINLP